MADNSPPQRVEVDLVDTPASQAAAADDARVQELTNLLEEAGDEVEGEGDTEETPPEEQLEAADAEDKEEPEEAPKPKKKRTRKAKPKEAAPSTETADETPDASEQARQYYALRQGQKQVREAMRQMEQQQRAMQEREAKLQEQEDLGRMMREKPTEAMRELARRGGMSPDVFYEQLTREQLDQPPDANMAIQETRLLKEELASLRSEMRERDEQREQRSQQAYMQQKFNEGVGELLSVQNEAYTQNEDARERWGHAMGLPQDELMIEARAQMRTAMQNGARLGPEELAGMMDTINRIAKTRFDAQRQFLDGYAAPAEDQDTSEPEQEPEPSHSEGTSPKTGKTPSTVTTHDTATGGVGHRQMSETAFWNQAGEKLGDFDV